MTRTVASLLRAALLALSVSSLQSVQSLAAMPELLPKPESMQPADKPAAPIPLGQVATEFDAAAALLDKTAADRRARKDLAAIEAALPALGREVDARARESKAILAQRPSLELLRDLDERWQEVRAALAARSAELTRIVTSLDRDFEALSKLDQTWAATLAQAREEKAPAEVIRITQSLRTQIAAALQTLDAERSAVLKVQARMSDLERRVTEALQANREARDATVDQMLTRDSPPLWTPSWRSDAARRIATGATEAFERQWTLLQIYLQAHPAVGLLQLILLGALAALLFWVRRRLVHLSASDPEVLREARVVEHPIASAIILTLLVTPWMYPQAPRHLWAISGMALLVPTIIVLRRLVPAHLLAPLYAVLAFFFVDQVRAVSASIDIIPRLLFVGEMIAAVAFLLWFARKTSLDLKTRSALRHRSALRLAIFILVTLCAAAAIANSVGYVALSNLVGNAVLDSMYAGLVLYTVVQILDALVEIGMRVQPLRSLGMVRTHQGLLRRRTRLALQWSAVILWVGYVLDRLAIRDRLLDALAAALDASLTLGAMVITLSGVLSFVLAIWAAFLVSRLVRFVLNEEVFPRTQLRRGIPYAISRSLHFFIIALGFFTAMGIAGMEMTQFTILVSAFTIGVGFGLQNIFNNFVSGLIVLYERPVQVGDMIQIDDAVGVVHRIGIRATIVRTASRSEVIVPNGKLISDRVINWTLSGRQRVIELPISVVLQSDPAQVIRILEQVAAAHPAVLGEPPPQAILTRMGPDWMGFELRTAIGEVEGWMRVRSELAVSAVAALRAAEVVLR